MLLCCYISLFELVKGKSFKSCRMTFVEKKRFLKPILQTHVVNLTLFNKVNLRKKNALLCFRFTINFVLNLKFNLVIIDKI